MADKTASIRYVEDKNGDVFFPVTHQRGVVDSDGTNLETALAGKQDALVSGTSIKTINGASILGPGNIEVQTEIAMDNVPTAGSDNPVKSGGLYTELAEKIGSQDIDNVVELTLAQYNALATKDARTMYIISDSTIASDHVGVASLVQTTTSTEDGGTNVWTCTLTNGQSFTLQVRNGNQGNSGYSGAAGELEVVNNVTQGGATAALSAEMGKQLEGEISQLGLEVNTVVGAEDVPIPLNFQTGAYYTSGGVLDPNSGSKYTEKINIKGASTISISGTFGSSSQRCTLFYDDNNVIALAIQEKELPVTNLDVSQYSFMAVSGLTDSTFNVTATFDRQLGDYPLDILFDKIGVGYESGFYYNGYDSRNATASVTNRTPFVVIKDVSDPIFITSIKMEFTRAGTITISKVKKTDVVLGGSVDRAKFYGRVVKTVELGEQTLSLGNYLLLPDEYLAVGYTNDTSLFAYGTYTPKDKLFYYVNTSTSKWASANSSLNIDVVGNQIVINDLRNGIESTYKGKTLSILGDSISTFENYIPSGNATYYPAGDVLAVTDCWWKKLIDALGMTINVNNSWSGSRVTTTGGDTSAGCGTRAESLGTLPDVIIIWMGINDFNNEVPLGTYDGKSNIPSETTTFREAYAIMLNKVLTAYPKAEVWVCTLPQCERNGTTGFPEVNGNGVALLDFNTAIEELARAFGVKVLDHNRCGLTYQNMTVFNPDELHPNKYGHSLVANNDIRQMDNSVSTRYATE